MKTAEELRDEGIRRVDRREWRERQEKLLPVVLKEPGTNEDIKVRLGRLGDDPPDHVNQWGGCTMSWRRRRLIEPTGKERKARLPKSHRRGGMLPVYRLATFDDALANWKAPHA